MGDNLHLSSTLPNYISNLFCEDLNAQDDRGNTALHKFVLYNKFYRGVLQKLINKGTDLEIKNEEGRTAFLLAVIHCQRFMIEKFIENGANVNTKDRFNQNALHYIALPEMNQISLMLDIPGAVKRFNATFPILKSLLEKGIDVNLMNFRRETPIMWAARSSHFKIVKMLLKHGANVHARSEYSKTCLHLASTSTSANEKAWDEPNSDIISELIRNGACVHCFDSENWTPLGFILLSRHPNKDYFAREFLTTASLVHWERRIDFYVHGDLRLEAITLDESLIKHVTDCYNEIDRMRNFQLSEKSNLCQFALRGVSVSEKCISDEVCDKVLDILLQESFPLYHDFMLFRFKLSYLQRKLRELHIFTQREGRNIFLNPDMNFQIASFLESKDLFNVFKASTLRCSYNIRN